MHRAEKRDDDDQHILSVRWMYVYTRALTLCNCSLSALTDIRDYSRESALQFLVVVELELSREHTESRRGPPGRLLLVPTGTGKQQNNFTYFFVCLKMEQLDSLTLSSRNFYENAKYKVSPGPAAAAVSPRYTHCKAWYSCISGGGLARVRRLVSDAPRVRCPERWPVPVQQPPGRPRRHRCVPPALSPPALPLSDLSVAALQIAPPRTSTAPRPQDTASAASCSSVPSCSFSP